MAVIAKPKSKRVASLDAFRGLTIVVMILVDNAGGVYPRTEHSPWDGCTLADFVLPFFFFSSLLDLRSRLPSRVPEVNAAVRKIILRTLKLFLWGLLLQGGYSHGPDKLTYGVYMNRLRMIDLKFRKALVYLVVALIETFTIKLRPITVSPDFFSIFVAYKWQWLGGFVSFLIYMITVFTLYVPNWRFVVLNSQGAAKRYTLINLISKGINHLYSELVWKRLKACAYTSPNSDSLREDSPTRCLGPFEPEGLLSPISAILSGTIGIHNGHVLIHFKAQVLGVNGTWFNHLAILLHFTDAIPMNKQLYSFSCMCMTAGVAGIMFMAYTYWKPFLFIEWIGMNAMQVFMMAVQASTTYIIFFESVSRDNITWKDVNWILKHVFIDVWKLERVGTLLYVIFTEIVFWAVVVGVLHKLRICWKL
ncbi:unnamed protein product [Coffea canephora]|uniref:Heparan-alpha-glucosaminide N-acetyltransferase catalytic domain-containing protein n=1 Tax=Coffea canephora TaxID=49390 RepID=A0A068U544_COFCA|nr:unnamed protein product [Coffea canephora]